MDPATIGVYMAMQAAGLIAGYKQKQWNSELSARAGALEQQQTNMNLKAIQLQTEQSSLNAMVDMRKNMGYQIATQSARGTEMQGTAASMLMGAETNFNKDEQVRRMNTLAKEADLRAAGVISGMHTFAAQSKLKNDYFDSALKMGLADVNAYSDYALQKGKTNGK